MGFNKVQKPRLNPNSQTIKKGNVTRKIPEICIESMSDILYFMNKIQYHDASEFT